MGSSTRAEHVAACEFSPAGNGIPLGGDISPPEVSAGSRCFIQAGRSGAGREEEGRET